MNKPTPQSQQTATSLRKVHIIMSGGLGQCGKSTLTRQMLEKNRSLLLVDADPVANVAIAYDKPSWAAWYKKTPTGPDYRGDGESLVMDQILFSGDLKHSNLFATFTNLVEETSKDMVVCLPVSAAIEQWLDDYAINTLMEGDRPFDLVCWWVSAGSVRSQQELLSFKAKYPNIALAAVFNKGITTDVLNWDKFEPVPDLDQAIKSNSIKRAEMQRWASLSEILALVENGYPLYDLLANGLPQQDGGRKPLGTMVKGNINAWLDRNHKSLIETGYL